MGVRVGSTTLPMPRGGGPELNEYAQEVKLILETAFAEIGGAATALTASTGLVAANNLSDVASAATARVNLAVLGIANNLSDVASAATARTNLAVLGTASNLSDLASAATARTNLGIPHAVAQMVNFETGAVATGTTIIPLDDTIPQSTEGDQYLTLAITPTNASSTLVIDVALWLASSAGAANTVVVALFQGVTASALAAGYFTFPVSNGVFPIAIRHKMTAGTTSSTTFAVRAGTNVASTLTLNGSAGARLLGGALPSSITITEILP